MSRHDDDVRLRHMRDACRQAIAFAQGRQRIELETNQQLALALTRLIEVIGEAAKNVSAETRERLAQIPWRAIAGTRDRLVHAYLDVDLDRLWQIVVGDLPPLLAHLEAYLGAPE